MSKPIDIEVKGIEEVKKLLIELQNKSSNLTPVMKSVGNHIKNITEKSFEQQKSPAGKTWKPSERALKTGDLTLIDSGLLANSIDYKAGKDGAVISSDRVYAAIHQFGGYAGRKLKTKIPARPFFPVDEHHELEKSVLTDITDLIKEYLMT